MEGSAVRAYMQELRCPGGPKGLRVVIDHELGRGELALQGVEARRAERLRRRAGFRQELFGREGIAPRRGLCGFAPVITPGRTRSIPIRCHAELMSRPGYSPTRADMEVDDRPIPDRPLELRVRFGRRMPDQFPCVRQRSA